MINRARIESEIVEPWNGKAKLKVEDFQAHGAGADRLRAVHGFDECNRKAPRAASKSSDCVGNKATEETVGLVLEGQGGLV